MIAAHNARLVWDKRLTSSLNGHVIFKTTISGWIGKYEQPVVDLDFDKGEKEAGG